MSLIVLRNGIVLRNEIVAAGGFEGESIREYLNRGLGPFTGKHHDYSRFGYPWKRPFVPCTRWMRL